MSKGLKNKVRVGILAESFVNWAGGIEFLKYVILGLSRNDQYELLLLIPDRNTTFNNIRNGVKHILNIFLNNRFTIIKFPPVEDTCKSLSAYLNISQYYTYKNDAQLTSLINLHCDIVLPAYNALSSKVKVPVIGYVFDVQHKYFPGFFEKKELAVRDEHFNNHVKGSVNIVVNAQSVKNDLEKYYLRSNNVHVIPFTPIFDSDLFEKIGDFEPVKLKYELGDVPYFLVSNQFWKHKGHLVAIEALLILIRDLKVDCKLVLTGKFNPQADGHCKSIMDFVDREQLHDKVKFVGFIEKTEQLNLLLNCCAVIQPTQFEGGPGGFIIFEALAYHQQCIVSDIDINKEIQDTQFVTFFEVNNKCDLAKKMQMLLQTKKRESTTEELKLSFESKRKTLENFWDSLIAEILENHN